MTEHRLRLAGAWSSYRNDDLDTYEITDEAGEAQIALVPVGDNAFEVTRQRKVLAMVTAAPVMLSAINAVLSEVLSEEPNLERCRGLLIDAAGAARGA